MVAREGPGVRPACLGRRSSGNRLRTDSVLEIRRPAGSKPAIQQIENLRYPASKSETYCGGFAHNDCALGCLFTPRSSVATNAPGPGSELQMPFGGLGIALQGIWRSR